VSRESGEVKDVSGLGGDKPYMPTGEIGDEKTGVDVEELEHELPEPRNVDWSENGEFEDPDESVNKEVTEEKHEENPDDKKEEPKTEEVDFAKERDELKAKVAELEGQLGDLSKLQELETFIHANKDVREFIKKVIKGESVSELEAKYEFKTPEKPEDFDPFEAYNDKDSKSYKWREATMKAAVESAVADILTAEREKAFRDGVRVTTEELSKPKPEDPKIVEARTKAINDLNAEIAKQNFTKAQEEQLMAWVRGGYWDSAEALVKGFKTIHGIVDKKPDKPSEKSVTVTKSGSEESNVVSFLDGIESTLKARRF